MTSTHTARPARARLTPGTWTTGPDQATAGFTVREITGLCHGTFAVRSGTLQVDAGGRPVRLDAVLDAASFLTDKPKRDRDVTSKRFLDADRFPDLAWSCDDISATEDGWVARGTLDAHGQPAPLTLVVTPQGSDEGDLHVVATGVVDRAAHGVKAPRFLIAREVHVRIQARLSVATD